MQANRYPILQLSSCFKKSPNGYNLLMIILLLSAFVFKVRAQDQSSFLPITDHSGLTAALQKQVKQTLRENSRIIWFEKNEGQFGGPELLYAGRTVFGSVGIYAGKIRLAAKLTEGIQVVDIDFPGAGRNLMIQSSGTAPVEGSYNWGAQRIQPKIVPELVLHNLYPGIDLRLYTGSEGQLEFDWIVWNAAKFGQIKMRFTGQDAMKIDPSGAVTINLRKQAITLKMPETYQIIRNQKINIPAKFELKGNQIAYQVQQLKDPNAPLIIDPVMAWSTYVHNNTSTFDEYLYAIAVNNQSELYACGITNEPIFIAYMSNIQPGFQSVYNYATSATRSRQTAILYRLNATGTAITAWTYTGQTNNIPVAMGVFPDNRVLVVYQRDTVQIFSKDLNSRLYNGAISSGVATSVYSYQSQAIADNNVFYLGGIAENNLPAGLFNPGAPDTTRSGREAVIIRVESAQTAPTPTWATYVGGSSSEAFTAIAITPDKSKLAFAVHVDGTGTNYPALIKAVDNSIAGTELLVGVLAVGKPSSFDVFSYLGGTGDEGKSSSKTSAALVACDNKYFYVAGNTTSNNLPGTTGAAQPAHGLNKSISDQFLAQIPLNGSAGTGFRTTYNGGEGADLVGGLVIDYRTNDVLLFGTTESVEFPVYNGAGYSPYYQAAHGNTSSGPQDITYTVFSNGLTTRKFSTYIGGSHNDYLGSTGKLQGTGHFQYCPTNGLTYIGTTIHSDQTTIPPQWMSAIPGFDKSIPAASTSKDSHFIFAMNPNTNDYGDAPVSYEQGNPAASAAAAYKLRIGNELDPEDKPNSSVMANGDDIQNFGSVDDEDGLTGVPSLWPGQTEYDIMVNVLNNTGADVNLYGWLDNNGNGLFDADEFTQVTVPSNPLVQPVGLSFSSLPPFASTKGYTILRLRLTNVTLTAANATGEFGIGEVEDHVILQALILPVQLLQFTAQLNRNQVALNWQFSDASVREVTIEKSTDGSHFQLLGRTTITGQVQTLQDLYATGSKSYYRLSWLADDGHRLYSAVHLIQRAAVSEYQVMPNPTPSITRLKIPAGKQPVCQLYDASGKLLQQFKVASGQSEAEISLKNQPPGVYLLQIITDQEKRRIPIVKQ